MKITTVVLVLILAWASMSAGIALTEASKAEWMNLPKHFRAASAAYRLYLALSWLLIFAIAYLVFFHV